MQLAGAQGVVDDDVDSGQDDPEVEAGVTLVMDAGGAGFFGKLSASNLCSDRDPNPLAGSCTSTRRPQLHRALSRCRIASQSLAPSLCSRDR